MVKVDYVEMLKNGTKIFDLSHIVEEDFLEAQYIADTGEYTAGIETEAVYNYRIDNNFVGVYECWIDDTREYNRFIDLLMSYDLSSIPTLENWQKNKIEINGRFIRLAKWLKYEGVEQSLIDFYSQQKKIGKQRYYFTVSDLPQHIMGMSYYSSDWESCMHPDDENSICLVSSLYDDSLLVGFLHRELKDLNDLKGNMLARVQMRIVEHDTRLLLVPSRYYGNDTHKVIMDRCIERLEELSILSRRVRFEHGKDEIEDLQILTMNANGFKELYVSDDILVQRDIDEYKDIECPMCEGNKSIKETMGTFRHNIDIDVDCPMCEGTGEYEIRIQYECNEVVSVNRNIPIEAYCDDYEHLGNMIQIGVSKERLMRHFEAF